MVALNPSPFSPRMQAWEQGCGYQVVKCCSEVVALLASPPWWDFGGWMCFLGGRFAKLVVQGGRGSWPCCEAKEQCGAGEETGLGLLSWNGGSRNLPLISISRSSYSGWDRILFRLEAPLRGFARGRWSLVHNVGAEML